MSHWQSKDHVQHSLGFVVPRRQHYFPGWSWNMLGGLLQLVWRCCGALTFGNLQSLVGQTAGTGHGQRWFCSGAEGCSRVLIYFPMVQFSRFLLEAPSHRTAVGPPSNSCGSKRWHLLWRINFPPVFTSPWFPQCHTRLCCFCFVQYPVLVVCFWGVAQQLAVEMHLY